MNCIAHLFRRLAGDASPYLEFMISEHPLLRKATSRLLLLVVALLLVPGCSSTRRTKPSAQDYGVVTLRPSALPRIAPDKRQRHKIQAIPPDWVLATVVTRPGGGLLLVDGWLEPSQRGADEGKERPGTSIGEATSLLKQGLWARLMLGGDQEALVKAVRLLADRGLSARVAALDTNLAALGEFRAAKPKLRLFHGPIPQLEEASAAKLRERGIACVVVPAEGIGDEAPMAMHDAGLSVGVWQADNEDQVARLVGLGADYYFTRNPEMVIDVQIKEGVRPSKIRKVKKASSVTGSTGGRTGGMLGR